MHGKQSCIRMRLQVNSSFGDLISRLPKCFLSDDATPDQFSEIENFHR